MAVKTWLHPSNGGFIWNDSLWASYNFRHWVVGVMFDEGFKWSLAVGPLRVGINFTN